MTVAHYYKEKNTHLQRKWSNHVEMKKKILNDKFQASVLSEKKKKCDVVAHWQLNGLLC